MPEEGIILDEEDETILNRVWAEIADESLLKQEQAKANDLQTQFMNGRTIKIHLPQGITSGIMTAEITVAWTGKLLAFPRTQLSVFKQREESRRAGIYILIGDDEDVLGKEAVYIGETEDLWQRLNQHDKIPNKNVPKDFWNRTVVVTSKDEHLTKSLVRYLESHLTTVVDNAKRATRIGGASPGLPKLPESDLADMEYFVSQIELILPVLGFNFVIPVPQVVSSSNATTVTSSQSRTSHLPLLSNNETSPIFVCNVPFGGGTARMQESGGEFIVFAGSKAAGNAGAALAKGHLARREQLIADGSLVADADGKLVFEINVPFKSTSAAASMITGSAASGPISWIVEGKTQTYAQWQASSNDNNESLDDESLDDSSASVVEDAQSPNNSIE